MQYKEKRKQGGLDGRRLPAAILEEPAMAVFVKLAGERSYLIDAVLSSRADVKFHDRYTSSCEDKASAAGIERESVLKVVFFEHDSKLYCVALPDEGEVDKKELFTKMLGISRTAAKNISIAKRLPEGMSYGTCTPFFTKSNIDEVAMVILASTEEPQRVVDVSLGGANTESRKCSLQMRYREVMEMLGQEFGDKVQVIDVPLKRRDG